MITTEQVQCLDKLFERIKIEKEILSLVNITISSNSYLIFETDTYV